MLRRFDFIAGMITAGLAALVFVGGSVSDAQPAAKAVGDRPAPHATLTAEAAKLGIPFDRYEVIDELGRTITFYLTPRGPEGSPAKPLALFVGGSGGQSVFMRTPDGRIGGGIQNLLAKVGKDRVRVMTVEKPGVEFLKQLERPGTGEGAGEEYNREHSFERWAAALNASVRAAAHLPGIDRTRVLACGHSEGAIMAAKVAGDNPGLVTHVAPLSGGGPTQLFAMAQLAWREREPDEPLEDRQRRMDSVFATWAEVQSDPESHTRFAWGHAHKRWSSFLRTSVLEQLLRSDVPIFLAHGTDDQADPIEAFDVLRAELTARGRDVAFDRVLGGDHGYTKPGEQGWMGLEGVIRGMVDWFLGPASAAESTPDAGAATR